MIEENNITLISICVGCISGIVLLSFFRIKNNSRGTSIQTIINGYSIKYHYLVWWFLIPSRFTYNIINYVLYEQYSIVFPVNIVLFLMFLIVVLNVASFIGFFSFKKYSWYTILLFHVVLSVENLVTVLFFPDNDTPIMIARLFGALTPSVLEFIYYWKRKSLFNNRTKQFNIDKNAVINFRSNFLNSGITNNGTNIQSDNEIMFCRKCGSEISSDAVYCKKCGTKII